MELLFTFVLELVLRFFWNRVLGLPLPEWFLNRRR